MQTSPLIYPLLLITSRLFSPSYILSPIKPSCPFSMPPRFSERGQPPKRTWTLLNPHFQEVVHLLATGGIRLSATHLAQINVVALCGAEFADWFLTSRAQTIVTLTFSRSFIWTSAQLMIQASTIKELTTRRISWNEFDKHVPLVSHFLTAFFSELAYFMGVSRKWLDRSVDLFPYVPPLRLGAFCFSGGRE